MIKLLNKFYRKVYKNRVDLYLIEIFLIICGFVFYLLFECDFIARLLESLMGCLAITWIICLFEREKNKIFKKK